MKTITNKTVALENLKSSLSKLVLEYSSNSITNTSSKEFEQQVRMFAKECSVLNNKSLATLVEYGSNNDNWDGGNFFWSLAMSHVESYLDVESKSSNSEDEDEEEEENEEEIVVEDDEEDDAVGNTGWITTFCEMSHLSKYANWLKAIPLFGMLFKLDSLISKLKDGFKSLLAIVVKLIRFITLADLMDKFASWVKEHHSHKRIVIELATFIDALMRLIAYVLLAITFALRPDKYVKKILPEEISEHLPGD